MPPMEVSAAASRLPVATPKRSAWTIGAIALQALWAVVLIVVSIYLLTHTPRSPEHALTLRLTGVMFGLPGIIAAAGCCGLWKSKRWGWWLSLIPDGVIASIFIYAVIDDARMGIVDGTLVGTTVLASITPLYLLLPVVRRFYWGGAQQGQAEPSL